VKYAHAELDVTVDAAPKKKRLWRRLWERRVDVRKGGQGRRRRAQARATHGYDLRVVERVHTSGA